jgi:hypothetical protein
LPVSAALGAFLKCSQPLTSTSKEASANSSRSKSHKSEQFTSCYGIELTVLGQRSRIETERLKPAVFPVLGIKLQKIKFFSILFIATRQLIAGILSLRNLFSDLTLYTNVEYAYNRNPDSIECDEMKPRAAFSINFLKFNIGFIIYGKLSEKPVSYQ